MRRGRRGALLICCWALSDAAPFLLQSAKGGWGQQVSSKLPPSRSHAAALHLLHTSAPSSFSWTAKLAFTISPGEEDCFVTSTVVGILSLVFPSRCSFFILRSCRQSSSLLLPSLSSITGLDGLCQQCLTLFRAHRHLLQMCRALLCPGCHSGMSCHQLPSYWYHKPI